MASTKTKDRSCLICTSSIPSENIAEVDKLETLFLLRILLEIPQESKLLDNPNEWINLIQICDHCAGEIKHCKMIYSEICEKIERFWECQNKVLENFSKEVNSKHKKDNDVEDWRFQCRKFVKDHNFTGFGYPFAVQDVETLLFHSQSSPAAPEYLQNDSSFGARNELQVAVRETKDNVHISEDPFKEIPSPLSQHSEPNESLFIKEEPELDEDEPDIQDDDEYNLYEDDNLSSDSDYNPLPSKKPKISPAKRNPTRKCNKQVKNESSQIKKSEKQVKTQSSQISQRHRRPISEILEIYPNFKPDPITKKLVCHWEDCGQQFADKKALLNHWDRHRGTPRNQCDECPQKFYSRREWVCHRQKEHPKEDDKFDCEKCGKLYKTREALLNHYRTTHDPKKEEERMARLKKKEEDPIKKDPVTNKWRCYWENCEKSYLDRHNLIFHLDRHKGTPQQKCEQCGELFFSKKQLVRHVEKEHEKDVIFPCEICGKNFNTSDGLRFHKSFMHSGGSGVPVVCQICGKTYKKGSMIGHMKFVHGSVEERKFACHLCPGSFAEVRGLNRHLWRMHQYCESEELKKKFLMQREKDRQTERKWRCHVKGCRVRFITEKGLKEHVEGVHKGKWDVEEDTNYKFNCEICGKGFHSKQKLTRHAKQHERD